MCCVRTPYVLCNVLCVYKIFTSRNQSSYIHFIYKTCEILLLKSMRVRGGAAHRIASHQLNNTNLNMRTIYINIVACVVFDGRFFDEYLICKLHIVYIRVYIWEICEWYFVCIRLISHAAPCRCLAWRFAPHTSNSNKFRYNTKINNNIIWLKIQIFIYTYIICTYAIHYRLVL